MSWHVKSHTQAITAWVSLLFKDQIVYRFPDSRFPTPDSRIILG
ncbi:hypothetical protein BJP36_36060 [Moorena producens JHB]|uniref:Uncharacterized protein n=1 Tax=Moorena producens (strain JHB) TaxID=1454205 RepID=A0A9Q9STS2_MOOP1|nr:hypothetical protein [Moorena producens]WAN69510.1 hypothetical protein BJP36_36060 [Moorena producens JHB]